MKKYLITLSIPLLWLSGCVITPDFSMNDEQKAVIPRRWEGPPVKETKQVHPPDESFANWWSYWKDPEVLRLVQRAVRHNTSVKVAQANLKEALASVSISDASLFPWFDGSVRAGRTHSNSQGVNSFSIGINGTWTIDAGGRVAASQAAYATALSNEATLGDVLVAISAQVVSAYIDLRLSQRQVKVALENLKTQKEALDIAGWRYRSGLVDSTDVDQARTSLEMTRSSLPTYRAAVAKNKNLIAQLTSLQPQEVGFDQTESVPVAPDNLSLNIPAEVLRQRPDVRAAEADVMAALARYTEARSALFPSLTLGGSIGLAGVSLGSLGDSGTHNSSILGTINIPIFHAGALRAQVEQRDAGVARANANYEAALLTGIKEVENALNNIWANQRRKKSLLVAVKAAQSAATNARQNYRAGLQDFTVVLTTQRSLLTVQESLATVEADIAKSYVDLYEAMGGGWSVPEEFKNNDIKAKR